MNAVTAQSLTVMKGTEAILHGLDFSIKGGAITGLMGPSGSGKTTLMRSLVGVQRAQGVATVLGKAAGSKELRKKIGYVSQSPAVYSDLTVQQNLDYFAIIARAKKPEVQRVIKQVDLQKHAKQTVHSLSGGQKARVSLAVALLGNPDLLILDEPTVGLDPVLRKKLWTLFREFADEGKTLIVSSHVMDEAEHCDNILLLRDGKLLWNAEREALLKDTNTKSVEAAFLRKVGAE